MTPDQAGQLADTGNPLLAKVPTIQSLGTVDTPVGQLAFVTFRTATTTFTEMLTKDELRQQIAREQKLLDSMSTSGLTVVRGHVTPVSKPELNGG